MLNPLQARATGINSKFPPLTSLILILVACGLAFTFYRGTKDLFIYVIEVTFETLAILTAIKINIDRKARTLLLISCVALLMGDGVSGLTYIPGMNLPEDSILSKVSGDLSEIAYTVFVLTLAGFIAPAWWHTTEKGKTKEPIFYLITLAILFFWLSLKSILIPFYNRDPEPTVLNLINSTFYWITTSALFSLSALTTLRSKDYNRSLWMNSITLFCITSFALAFNSGFNRESAQYPLQEWGWVLAVVLFGITLSKSDKTKPFWTEISGNSGSIRIGIISAVLIGNLIQIGVILLLNIQQILNAFDITHLLLVLFTCWSISNAIGIFFEKRLVSVTQELLGSNLNLRTEDPNMPVLPSSSHLPLFEHIKSRVGLPEFDQMISNHNRVIDHHNSLLKRFFKSESEKAALISRSHLSAQVAHDIRSPLAALSMAERDLGVLPEETRIIIRSAIGRIQDIASQLMLKASANTDTPAALDVPAPVEATLLSSVLETILAEKRMQYRSRLGVKIESYLSPSSQAAFAIVQPREFKRVISNLINNAIEAIADTGTIELTLERSADSKSVTLKIRDSGKGIPPEALKQLGTRGFTQGKDGGSGLGLHHARASLESWGGQIEIESTLGVGTTVALHLPVSTPPDWFLPALELKANSQIVILDDDQSIHQVWQGRMESAHSSDHGVTLIHFSTPQHLRAWHESRTPEERARETRYLIDYEIIGADETGLDIIEKLGIAEHSVLVTSRYEEPSIRARCEALGLKLLPKGLAGFVTITVHPTQALPPIPQPDAVLLDDDNLVHTTWKMVARQKQKTLQAYTDPDALMADLPKIAKSTPIYIDSNLGKGVRGEDILQKLSSLGYLNLNLATGYEPGPFQKKLASTPGFKSVQDKSPPW